MKKVFLYAGQGSQKVGMGLDFYQEYPSYRSFLDSLNMRTDFIRLMHEGPAEELSKTENTQVCMAIFAAGVTRLLSEHGIEAEAACGLSLGEYGALYAAGVFTEERYINILRFRGKVMMETGMGIKSAMSAVMGCESEVIRDVCESVKSGYVTVANYNCPGQAVICGEETAVSEAEEKLKSLGAKRCVRLNVSGPFHTRYMEPAGKALAAYFKNMHFAKPRIPVAMNVTGTFAGEADLKDLLVRQVQSSVYLEQDLMSLLDRGYTDFLEIGPGNTMAGFLKRTARKKGVGIRVSSIDSTDDFRKVIENER